MWTDDDPSISASNDDTVWTSQEKDDEEATEELPSVVPKDPNHDIPNGGFKAWLQVLGSFFLFFNSWFVPPRPSRAWLHLAYRIFPSR
jgi:hypothetical protein